MIKLENYEVLGWEHAIRGMRNPMNSWGKSDSLWANGWVGDRHMPVQWTGEYDEYVIGPNDQELMKKLANAGPVHGKFRRMITVYVDITAPLYWWKEFDTYKVGTVANSCSTMHKIQAKEFTMDDFSHEHLITNAQTYNGYIPNRILWAVIDTLNEFRKLFLETKSKLYWWQMIQLLPTSYNQKRTVMLNYEVLVNIYHSRKNHKLDEWHTFCDWIRQLPYSELITGGE